MALKYYLEQTHNDVVAYEQETEFFVIFNRRDSGWNNMPYSFMTFLHDYIDSVVQIDEEKASSITNGILPYQKLEKYHDMLIRNGSALAPKKK